MDSYNYIALKKKENKTKLTNVFDLFKENRLEQKKEKRQNVYIAIAAVSVLAVSGYIISI
tara:strand:- start:3703 stop:3882 length:180 start_codon:yes stop_codon:yes gene_type:complete